MLDLRPFIHKWRLAIILVAAFTLFYLFNIDGWLMHDDEGTDFYEVWQLQEGEKPGVDYLAEQQPLYLLSGRLLLEYSQQPVTTLRAFAAFQVLVAALILAAIVNMIWGKNSALLSLGLLLGCGILYEQARLFRPDPMMFAWEVIGLSTVLAAIYKDNQRLWAIAGGSFGMALLWKPFGIFPVVGLLIFFIYWAASNKNSWLAVFKAGIYFSIPFLLIAAGGSLLLYSKLGFYYSEAFNYHLEANQNNGFAQQLLIVGGGYFLFIVSNAIFLFILPLRFLNRKLERTHRLETAVLLAQLLVPAIFITITRPIHLRYYLFLLPTLSILLSIEADLVFQKLQQATKKATTIIPISIVVIIAIGWLITKPEIPNLLVRQESDTMALANLIAERTSPTDVVISDYAGINFFAKRPSIYEASIIAGAQIDSGSVTGALLIERIEETDSKIILIHVADGEPRPHQLVNLVDYNQFRAYVEAQFDLVTIFARAGQQIEVFERK